MSYFKVLISIPGEDIGDIKWPLTQDEYVTLARGIPMDMPAAMYDTFACMRDDLKCTAVWDITIDDWMTPVSSEEATALYSTRSREPGPW
jgi:hypothetical protein